MPIQTNALSDAMLAQAQWTRQQQGYAAQQQYSGSLGQAFNQGLGQFPSAGKSLVKRSLREELQLDTDEWLRDVGE